MCVCRGRRDVVRILQAVGAAGAERSEMERVKSGWKSEFVSNLANIKFSMLVFGIALSSAVFSSHRLGWSHIFGRIGWMSTIVVGRMCAIIRPITGKFRCNNNARHFVSVIFKFCVSVGAVSHRWNTFCATGRPIGWSTLSYTLYPSLLRIRKRFPYKLCVICFAWKCCLYIAWLEHEPFPLACPNLEKVYMFPLLPTENIPISLCLRVNFF